MLLASCPNSLFCLNCSKMFVEAGIFFKGNSHIWLKKLEPAAADKQTMQAYPVQSTRDEEHGFERGWLSKNQNA